MSGRDGIDCHDGAVDAGPGAVLAQAMRDEIASLYDGVELDGDDMPRAGPAELSPPGGAFLLGWRGAEAICCGGVKRLDVGNFNANPVASFWGEKQLAARTADRAAVPPVSPPPNRA